MNFLKFVGIVIYTLQYFIIDICLMVGGKHSYFTRRLHICITSGMINFIKVMFGEYVFSCLLLFKDERFKDFAFDVNYTVCGSLYEKDNY